MYLRLFTYGECVTIKKCSTYEYLINAISIIYNMDIEYCKRYLQLKDLSNLAIVNEMNFKYIIFKKKEISLNLEIIEEEDYSLDLEPTKEESKLTNILIKKEHLFCSICNSYLDDKLYKCLCCKKYQCNECKGFIPNIISNNHSFVEIKSISSTTKQK